MKTRFLTLIAAGILILIAVAHQSTPPQLFAGQPTSDASTPLTAIQVNSTADVIADDGQCTLREAITAANMDTASGTIAGECAAGSGDDTIIIPSGHYVLTLVGAGQGNATGDLNIDSNITIQGNGIGNTILDGNGTDRVISAYAPQLILKDLTITNGRVPDDLPGGNGGGIAYWGPRQGTLILWRVAVRENRAGGALQYQRGGDGGGIFTAGRLFLEWSEVSGNWAGNGNTSGYGGGIYFAESYGEAMYHRIRLSTISDNHTYDGGRGGAMAFHTSQAHITLSQVTITNNLVGDGTSGEGGGIHTTNALVRIKGVLLAGNRAALGPDCGFHLVSLGGNLLGNNQNCDLNNPQASDQENVDPLLKPLADNGGNGGRTHALYDNSPALDHGSCEEALTTDQRGLPRPVDLPTIPNDISACDIGAWEAQSLKQGTTTPTITLTPSLTVSPTPTGTPTPTASRTPTSTITPTPIPQTSIIVNSTADVTANDGQCTLREAITAANNNATSGSSVGECAAGGASDLVLVPAGHYRLTFSAPAPEDNNLAGDLDITASLVTIRGAGAGVTIIDGNGTDRVFHGQSAAVSPTLEDMTITNGQVPLGGFLHGGGIAAENGLILRRVAVRNNHTNLSERGDGGGIYVVGNFRIENSEISENVAQNGGGIYALNATDDRSIVLMSTISGNRAVTGLPSYGGGIYFGIEQTRPARRYSLEATTIVNNVAESEYTNQGGGIHIYRAIVVMKGSILANNAADQGPNCHGRMLSGGGNVVGDITGEWECRFVSVEEDQVNVDPLIDILRDNGGGTRTHALLDGSLAVDRGFCLGESTDQRGFWRPINHPSIPDGIGACDAGAFEVQALPGSPTPTEPPYFTPTATPTFTPLPTATALPEGDIFVNSTEDVLANDGYCTLREAIIAANEERSSGTRSGECARGNGADIIIVPAGSYELTRWGHPDSDSWGDLDIRSDISLLGMGRDYTTIDANGIDRVLEIHFGSSVAIEGLAITGGQAPAIYGVMEGGGILVHDGTTVTIADAHIWGNRAGGDGKSNHHGGHGGGIAQMGGTLTVRNTLIHHNSAGDGGPPPPEPTPSLPGGSGGNGGGIYITTHATIEDSSFVANQSGAPYFNGQHGQGAGIYSVHDVTIKGSTFTGHTEALSAYSALISNSTFVSNGTGIIVRNGMEATGITVAYNTSGLNIALFAFLANSLIDQNQTQCIGSVYSQGYNLFGNGFDCDIYGTVEGNQIGVDARLGSLGNYGGRTDTLPLLPSSPALDAGNCFGSTTDQRGFPRPSDLPDKPNVSDGCDIGAFEVQAPPTATVPSGEHLYLPLIRR